MNDYNAPVAEMRFVLRHVAALAEADALPGRAAVDAALVDSVLAEAGRFAREVLSPLHAAGDREGARLEAGTVRAPRGYAAAYRAYVDAGWGGVAAPQVYGGQALPYALAMALEEMWNAGCLAFALAPMLTAGVVHALETHGSDAQKRLYLPPLVSGRWCGTMNLTEPQAGSDLSALRTLATPEGDAYRLCGTKVFVSWGEHELSENIVHLVLARTPDAPAGVRGISLFIVPKFLPRPDGTPGERNDIACVSLERKAGLHGSPTCMLAYGERQGALGYLVGEAGRGLEYMFTMMNHARLSVGLEGVALAERAYQAAAAYAATRIQGREAGSASGERVAIVRHPDVRRMLLSMRCRTEAMRALAYYAGATADVAAAHPQAEVRRRHASRLDLLTPVVKAWCTEQAVDIASLAIQVHGGMGYVEETGVAQLWRDARVTPIYEGTNGIQANDLVGRKLAGDGGAAIAAFIADIRRDLDDAATVHESLHPVARACRASVADLERATRALLGAGAAEAAAVAVPYLELLGSVAGGWMSVRAAGEARRHAGEADAPPCAVKLATARFYADHVLSRTPGLAHVVAGRGASILGFPGDAF